VRAHPRTRRLACARGLALHKQREPAAAAEGEQAAEGDAAASEGGQQAAAQELQGGVAPMDVASEGADDEVDRVVLQRQLRAVVIITHDMLHGGDKDPPGGAPAATSRQGHR
jgi:hypothetical protein